MEQAKPPSDLHLSLPSTIIDPVLTVLGAPMSGSNGE